MRLNYFPIESQRFSTLCRYFGLIADDLGITKAKNGSDLGVGAGDLSICLIGFLSFVHFFFIFSQTTWPDEI